LPVALAGWTDKVLHSASVIYLVTSLTVPSAHRLGKFFELLRNEGMTKLPLRLIVNRYRQGPSRGNDVSLSQFEKAIGRKADFLIPNDYSLISMSHGLGKPAVLVKPNGPFSLAVTKMLSSELASEPDASGRRSWFSFRRS
jgi:Flp pilus assembly CpaE family ATPase